MLSAEENDLICRVGPGTPMGELMRRHWIPALMSSELVADGEPVRVMLLGEKLIAFRDTAGRVGLMDHECPHRCASLFYGRNEEGGLRCIYHGWKFDVEGNCLDMANVPPHQDFKDKIHATAYKTSEWGGMVWTYMGPGEAPGLPGFPCADLPEDQLRASTTMRDCNWLQMMEGNIDTSHAEFLHGGKRTAVDYAPDDPRRFGPMTRAPEYEVAETEWGTTYGAIRPADQGRKYWRIGHFLLPFWTMVGQNPFAGFNGASAAVPMDDEHVMIVSFGPRRGGLVIADAAVNRSAGMPQAEIDRYLPNTTDWFGRWRQNNSPIDDYGMDRERQRTLNYSGILGINQQDQAVTESMGPIENRTKEHLAQSDRMIMATRRRLIDAARSLSERNVLPATVTEPNTYRVTPGLCLADEKKALWEVYQEQIDLLKAGKDNLQPAAQ
jgi:phthalate 4,5-dioxygenase oxygenase subunit